MVKQLTKNLGICNIDFRYKNKTKKYPDYGLTYSMVTRVQEISINIAFANHQSTTTTASGTVIKYDKLYEKENICEYPLP